MTTASELFHTRRSRYGRGSHLELIGGGEEEPPPPPLYSHFDRTAHHNTNRRHHRRSYHHNSHHNAAIASTASSRRDLNRLQFDAFDPPLPRRSPHHPRPHRPAIPDRDSGLVVDQGSGSSASEEVSISQNGRSLRDRLRSPGSERLPGTVILARERLLQRLRGVTISANRQRFHVSSSIHHNNDTMIEDDFSLANGVDWENEVSQEWFTGSIPYTDILSLDKTKRPQGLTQDALDDLQVETFSKMNKGGEEEEEVISSSRGLEECSICLESYVEGDKLKHLSCGHRFHCYCLDPWLRICGDCPYCRKAVVTATTSCRLIRVGNVGG